MVKSLIRPTNDLLGELETLPQSQELTLRWFMANQPDAPAPTSLPVTGIWVDVDKVFQANEQARRQFPH